MAKRAKKRKYTALEVVELLSRRASDESGKEDSEEESHISSDDSVAEDMFLQGEDITLDK